MVTSSCRCRCGTTRSSVQTWYEPAVPRRCLEQRESTRGARRYFYVIFCGSAGVSDDCNEQGFATVASDRPAHSVIETALEVTRNQ